MIKNLNILPRKALALSMQLGAILFGNKKISNAQARKTEENSRSFILYKLVDTLHLTDREIEIIEVKQSTDELSLNFSGVKVEITYSVQLGKKNFVDDNGCFLEDAKNRVIVMKTESKSTGFSLKEITLESVLAGLESIGL